MVRERGGRERTMEKGGGYILFDFGDVSDSDLRGG